MKRLRSFLIVVAILLFGILCTPNSAYATLQSNPSTQYKTKKISVTWLSEIRKMETTGGAMGLTEQLNSDLTPKTDSNNIDVHMMKNTEYGAIAILSASSYGNPKTIMSSTIKTTTGNKTGVYYDVDNGFQNKYTETVAGGMMQSYIQNFNVRYINIYTSDSDQKVGDALNIKTWHDSQSDGRVLRNRKFEWGRPFICEKLRIWYIWSITCRLGLFQLLFPWCCRMW